MKKLWFKAKTYGYGWYPATWEGWLSSGVWLLAVLVGMKVFVHWAQAEPAETWPAFAFLTYQVVLIVALLALCVKKGEKASWRWGKPKEPKK